MSTTGDNFNVHNIDLESGSETNENATVKLGEEEVELHLPKLRDVGHPKVPEVSQDYISREINGVRDVELLSYVIEDPDFFALLEGEAAVGKNFSIDTVLGAANWPRVRVNFGMGTTYENLVGRYAPASDDVDGDEIIGRMEVIEATASRIFDSEKHDSVENAKSDVLEVVPELLQHSNFQWVDGLLTKAVKNGWAFVADEINAAEDEAIMPLNGLTEDRNSRYLTIEEKSEVIEPHPRFRFIATRNPLSYEGVGAMNSALESRGYIIPYEYHEEMALKQIVKNRSDILENESEAALDALVSLANDIRRQEQAGNSIITKISTRDIIKTARLTDIMSIQEACLTVFLGVSDPTDEDSIKEFIKTQKFR